MNGIVLVGDDIQKHSLPRVTEIKEPPPSEKKIDVDDAMLEAVGPLELHAGSHNVVACEHVACQGNRRHGRPPVTNPLPLCAAGSRKHDQKPQRESHEFRRAIRKGHPLSAWSG